MINLQKIKFLLLFLFLPCFFLNSQFKIYFIYKNAEYYVGPIDIKEIEIEPFDALKIIDQSQTHRTLINTFENSKLSALLYVGDKFEFNNIELKLKYDHVYQIRDKATGITLSFGLGKYRNIILYSSINFGKKRFDITDKLASVFTVKLFLKKMAGRLDQKDFVVDNKGLPKEKIIKEYEKFIEQLRSLKKEDEIFGYLKKYVELNFQLEGKKSVTGEWTHPADLYFYKKGDYKSFAFFYYYTLKQLGFKVRSYLVSNLIKKNEEELERMYDVFSKKVKNSDVLREIQKIETEYKHVDASSNVKDFTYNYKHLEYTTPAKIFFYYPPQFDSSTFLITVEVNNRWHYTTGDVWINAGIRSPERACAHYSRNGCYYAYFEKDFIILNNLAFTEEGISWDIFYNTK